MAQAFNNSSRASWLSDVLFLGILVTAFYFFWLGHYPLFTPDEGRYAEAAREMLVSGDYITPRVNGIAFLDKPVLYYWLQALAMHLFGVNEWSIRFFPALFGIYGCLAVYLAGRFLFNRRTGLLSAVILATTPLYYCCAHYANLDLEVAVLITSTLLLFISAAVSTDSLRSTLFILAYIFAGLGFLTKGLIALAFPAMIGGLWIMLLARWRLLIEMHLLKGILIAAAIILPWFVLVSQANPSFLHYFFVTQQVTRFLSAAAFNNPTPFWFYLPVVFAGFLPWSAFLPGAFVSAAKSVWQSRHEHAVELFLLLWALVIFIFFSIPHSKTISYILPVLPPLALLCGKFLADQWEAATLSRSLKISVLMLVVFYTVFAAALLIAPQKWYDMPTELMPTFLVAGVETGVCAALLMLTFPAWRLNRLFAACLMTSFLMLLTILSGAKYMNPNSAKSLIAPLRQVMQPQDIIVNYFKFYQDIPIYLGQTVKLVADWQSPAIAERDNWVREMWYSMPFQKTDDILLSEKVFWPLWHSKKRLYVFLNRNYLPQFEGASGKYYLVAQQRDILLVTNHPLPQQHY